MEGDVFNCHNFINTLTLGEISSAPKMRKIVLITSLGLIAIYFLFQKLSGKKEDKPSFSDVKNISIQLPYTFKTAVAKGLSKKAEKESKNKNYTEAVKLLESAIKAEPSNPSLYFDIADCYSATDSFNIALRFLNKAIELDSTYYGFYNNRGLVYYKLSDNDKAILDYQKALKLDSTQSMVYINLALAHYSNYNDKEACAALKMGQSLGFNVNELGEKVAKDLEGTCK
jgi:tetratricopeptide (TPR) repeat protein